jgi:diguanylate cyclase (GGDEF)-like protein
MRSIRENSSSRIGRKSRLHEMNVLRFRLVLYCFLAGTAFVSCGRPPKNQLLTTVAQIRALSPGQVKAGVPVRITGILTYSGRVSDSCFVQDATGGIRVVFAKGQTPPQAAWKVVVSGLAGSGGWAPSVINAKVLPLNPALLPVPAVGPGGRLNSPEHEYQWITIEGVMQSVVSEWTDTMGLDIRTSGGLMHARLSASVNQVREWTDTEIRAGGVLSWTFEPLTNAARPVLSIPDLGAIQVLKPGKSPADLQVTPIAALSKLAPARLPAHRVRLQGMRYALAGGAFGIMDGTGQIPFRKAPDAFDAGSPRLDIAGFPVFENGRVLLDQAFPVYGGAEQAARLPAPKSVLRTALQVHSLTPEAAAQEVPVRLHAVVTYFDQPSELLFVQDRTGGVFVRTLREDRLVLRAGDLVEVNGVSTPGFAPDVNRVRINVLGRAALPEPSPGSDRGAFLGREDCRWVQLAGIVQSIIPSDGGVLLTLAWGKERYKAHVQATAQQLSRLADAEVTLRGVCAAVVNGRRQMIGIELYVPGEEHIRLVRYGAKDPFSTRVQAIQDLLQFSNLADAGHRVHVRGTVTYDNRAGSIWIRDASGGVLVHDIEGPDVSPGDIVEAAGFPEASGLSPVLRNAIVRRLKSERLPNPARITAAEAMTGDYDSQLVRIEGRVLDRLIRPGEEILTLESGETVYSAVLPKTGSLPPVAPGALLSLTGICAMEVQEAEDLVVPRAFRLLLRSPADIAVVENAPWLSSARLIPILAVTALLVLAALIWVRMLRNRVKAQTRDLVFQTNQLSEANRLANEAVRSAHEAELLEQDRKHILELIARDEPVDAIIGQIAHAVTAHCKSRLSVIVLSGEGGTRIVTAPAVSAGCSEILEAFAASMPAGGSSSDIEKYCNDSVPARALNGHCGIRCRTASARPIVVDSRAVGAIAVFLEEQKESGPVGEQLAAWCSIASLTLERRNLYDELSYRATYDALTGLPNRGLLYERLESEIALATRGGSLVGLLYVDLDGLKEIHDRFGHRAGDAILQETARRMLASVRRGDMVARIGGDEFVVILPLLRAREDAEQMAAKVAAALEQPVDLDHQQLSIGASLGVSVWPLDGPQPELLLHAADAHMYSEKNSKKRRWYEALVPSQTTASPRPAYHPSSDIVRVA